MSDKLKKGILIIVLILVNVVLIVVTANSVIKAILHVFETGGVSNTEEVNVDESVTDNDEVENTGTEILPTNTEAQITLETVANGVKIIASNEEKINYLQYSLDDNEMQKIEINETQYETTIQISEGQHILKIEVVDVNEVKTTKEQEVVGDVEPIVLVQSKLINGKATFVIEAEDDENIKTICITHNGGEEQIVNIYENIYYEEIAMTEGETNTLIVTVTNINSLSTTKRVRFDNM